MNIYPYVYRIDHPSGEFYIGYRCTNKVPAEQDFGHVYKTSTKNLSYPFEEYTQTILAEFYLPSGKTDAYDFEQLTIFEHWGNPGLANRVCHHGKVRWSTVGLSIPKSQDTKKKMSEAKRGRTFSAEHKLKISEAQRGKKHSDESKLKMSISASNRTYSGKGRKLSDETKMKMSIAAKKRHAAH